MAAKARKNSIYVVYEGYREGYFLDHLKGYSNVRLNTVFSSGGSANEIVITGIKHSARDVNVYVLFDEDFEGKPDQRISDETLEGLAKAWKLNKDALIDCPYKQLQALNTGLQNPILIVSQPQSIDGFLLQLLDNTHKNTLEGKTTKQLKEIIKGMLGNIRLYDDDTQQIQSYDEKINLYKEELAKQIQSDPNYRERRHLLESKIRDCGRSKNKVVFMRFLSDKLSMPLMLAKRKDIPELDVLLKAFGL
jgi:5S rRNA maturation endonuclease (ribonuclease M5)